MTDRGQRDEESKWVDVVKTSHESTPHPSVDVDISGRLGVDDPKVNLWDVVPNGDGTARIVLAGRNEFALAAHRVHGRGDERNDHSTFVMVHSDPSIECARWLIMPVVPWSKHSFADGDE